MNMDSTLAVKHCIMRGRNNDKGYDLDRWSIDNSLVGE